MLYTFPECVYYAHDPLLSFVGPTTITNVLPAVLPLCHCNKTRGSLGGRSKQEFQLVFSGTRRSACIVCVLYVVKLEEVLVSGHSTHTK